MKGGGLRGSRRSCLEVYLLGQHFAAKSYAAIQGNGGKVGASPTLMLRPGSQGGCEAGKCALNQADKRVVETNSLQAGAIFRALGAQLQELHDTHEVLTY